MSAALSRRGALRGSLAASLGLAAGVAPALAALTLSANDAHLVALADAYEDLERRCNENTVASRSLVGEAADAAQDEFDALMDEFAPIEEEIAATPADSLVGLLAKARACQVPTARAFAENDHVLSVVDDLHRLFGRGRA